MLNIGFQTICDVMNLSGSDRFLKNLIFSVHGETLPFEHKVKLSPRLCTYIILHSEVQPFRNEKKKHTFCPAGDFNHIWLSRTTSICWILSDIHPQWCWLEHLEGQNAYLHIMRAASVFSVKNSNDCVECVTRNLSHFMILLLYYLYFTELIYNLHKCRVLIFEGVNIPEHTRLTANVRPSVSVQHCGH